MLVQLQPQEITQLMSDFKNRGDLDLYDHLDYMRHNQLPLLRELYAEQGSTGIVSFLEHSRLSTTDLKQVEELRKHFVSGSFNPSSHRLDFLVQCAPQVLKQMLSNMEKALQELMLISELSFDEYSLAQEAVMQSYLPASSSSHDYEQFNRELDRVRRLTQQKIYHKLYVPYFPLYAV